MQGGGSRVVRSAVDRVPGQISAPEVEGSVEPFRSIERDRELAGEPRGEVGKLEGIGRRARDIERHPIKCLRWGRTHALNSRLRGRARGGEQKREHLRPHEQKVAHSIQVVDGCGAPNSSSTFNSTSRSCPLYQPARHPGFAPGAPNGGDIGQGPSNTTPGARLPISGPGAPCVATASDRGCALALDCVDGVCVLPPTSGPCGPDPWPVVLLLRSSQPDLPAARRHRRALLDCLRMLQHEPRAGSLRTAGI